MSKRKGFNSISNSNTTTVHCARTHLDGVSVRVATSVGGGAMSFVPGFSRARGRPAMLPSEFPGLLMGKASNVTMNVTAGVPPRGLHRIVSTIIRVVSSRVTSGRRAAVRRVLRVIGKPSFPANTRVLNAEKVRRTCEAKHNGVEIHTIAGVRPVRGKGGEVVIARLPCVMGGTHLVRGVTRLMESGGVSKVASLDSRSGHRNVEVYVRLHHSIGPGMVLGRLCGRARLRSAFNIVVLTLISGRPGIVGLLRVLRCCLHRRRSIIAEEARCSLGGTRRETRVLRKLLVTLSGVSRIVHVVHNSGGIRRTGTRLVGHFKLDSIRTRTVMSVHLHTLANLRHRGVRTRCTRLVGGVRRCGTVLTSGGLLLNIVGGRVLMVTRGCNSSEEAGVKFSRFSVSVRSLVPHRGIMVAVAGLKCVGEVSVSAFGDRGHNNGNVGKVRALRSSCVQRLFVAADRRCVVFFAGANHICELGTCRVPRTKEATHKATVVGLLRLVPRRGVATVVPLHRCRRNGCLFVTARGNLIGGAPVRSCTGIEGAKLTTVMLHRSSGLVRIGVASGARSVFLIAGCNVYVHFGRASMHSANHISVNMHNVGLASGSIIVNVRVRDRNGSVLVMSRHNVNGHASVSRFAHRGHNNGNIGYCGVARGAKGIIKVGTMSRSDRVVVVGARKVVVHVGYSSVSICNEVASNMGLVGLGRGSAMTDITGIEGTSTRVSNRRIRVSSRSRSRGSRRKSISRAARRRAARRWDYCILRGVMDYPRGWGSGEG